MRTLSSSQTFWIKVVFPLLWIAGFAAVTLAMFVQPLQGSDEALKWIFLLLTVAGATFLYWTCMRLKRVRMDDQALYVSNYLREIRIPLQQVENIDENYWINLHPITVEFRNETDFGKWIVFMPKIRWFSLWSSHPVVEEIRQAVSVSAGSA